MFIAGLIFSLGTRQFLIIRSKIKIAFLYNNKSYLEKQYNKEHNFESFFDLPNVPTHNMTVLNMAVSDSDIP